MVQFSRTWLFISFLFYNLSSQTVRAEPALFPSDHSAFNAAGEIVTFINGTDQNKHFTASQILAKFIPDSSLIIPVSPLYIAPSLPANATLIDEVTLGILSRYNIKWPAPLNDSSTLRRIIILHSSFYAPTQKIYPNIQIIVNNNIASSLDALRSGAVDGIVIDPYSANFLRRYTPFSTFHFHSTTSFRAYIYLNTINPVQARILSAAVLTNTRELYRSIYQKWQVITLAESLGTENKGVSFVLTGALLLALVLTTFTIVHLLLTRRNSQQKRDDAVQFWESLIQSIPTPTLVCTPEGTITHSNSALLDYIRSNDDEVTGINLQDFSAYYHITPSLNTRLLVDAITHPQPQFTEGSIQIQGETFSLLQWISVIHDTLMVPRGLIIGWLDITQRKSLEKELAAALQKASSASAEKSRFLAHMSHELRSPLNVITGVLETEIHNNLQPDSLLPIAGSAANQLLETIGNILDLSKIEAGELHLHLQPTSLEDLLKQIIEHFQFLADQKSLIFEYDINAIKGNFYLCDKGKLGQIITNLLSNAVKYTSAGTIQLFVTRTALAKGKDEVTITIKDSGIGISPHHIPLILKEYKQVDDSKPSSTGLGLSITNQLISLMAGHLSVISQQGQGAEFTVTLPMATTQAETITSTAINPLSPQAILAVDDQPANLTVLSLQLKTLGHNVVTATEGSEALRILQHQQIDIIITDCHMEPVDGYTLASEVRKYEKDLSHTHFILGVTANAFSDEEPACLKAGMDALLIKPFKRHILEQGMSIFSTLKHINLSEVDALAGNNANRLALLNEILQGAHTEMTAISACALQNDTVLLKKSLHKMKGTYGLVEFSHGLLLCEEVERQISMGLSYSLTLLKLERANYHLSRKVKHLIDESMRRS